jgi:hypothetical protein
VVDTIGRGVSAQLRLFPLIKPLVERFGNDFFKAAPREPGVYVMSDARERILYIGQSKNLRTRLAYYKNANPDRMPRRLVRLVHQVEAITWECCPTGAAARARELELLRTHRPKFNRADTAPQFFHYVETSETAGKFSVELHFDAPPSPGAVVHGPLRGRMIPAQGLAALQRLWIGATRGIQRCADLPILPRRMTKVELDINSDNRSILARTTIPTLPRGESRGQGPAEKSGIFPQLRAFFDAGSPEVVAHLLSLQRPDIEPALRQLQECDAETLLMWARLLAEGTVE